MAGVDDDGKVRQLAQHGDRRKIERIAGVGLKGAHAALAENDILVAAGHDVLRAHQPFLVGRGHTALDHHGLFLTAHSLQKVEVLHIARADLNDVHILEERKLAEVHQLGDDGQPRLLLGDLEVAQADLAEALEGIGRGAGLERAAAQHRRAAGLDRLRDGDHLLLGFHRAGAGHEREVAAADLRIADLDDGILGMELAVGVLIRLLHTLDVLDDVQRGNEIGVYLRGVAHQAEEHIALADAGVNDDALFLQPCDQALQLLWIRIVLEYDDHGKIPP